MRLLLAVPTYGGGLPPEIDKRRRITMMVAANMGIQWMGDVSYDRAGWAKTRNMSFKDALAARSNKGEKADGVIWFDDDILMPPDAVVKMVGHFKDMVSGMYFQRGGDHLPVCGRYMTSIDKFESLQIWEDDKLIPQDGVGFGCVYTSLPMLEKVAALKECQELGPFGGEFGKWFKKSYGEDYLFCLRAKKAGFQPYLDTGIQCRHYEGPMWSDKERYIRERNIEVPGHTRVQ